MALFDINEESSIPIWVQLKNRFVYLITSGHYQPGDQLPTVRGLAAEIGVNYNTVSKVYMSLEQDGLIQSRRRQGAFVLDVGGRHERTLSSMAEVVTQEYFERCIELGMSLDDIQERFSACMERARAAQS
ncbi:MAG: GntR family transcriptional regulator [Coriobacteriia bacterium]|nr:GntR family transcriptional regulator [Coriobacteriia bacterium]MBS5478041.1 GntR family transcriptional regulator [Coriobacteriia bacterium]